MPPSSVLGVAVLIYAIPEIYYWSLFAQWGPQPEHIVFDRIRQGLAMTAVVAYAGFRVLAFHPFYRDEYCKWLAGTPWRRGLRLPLGPLPIAVQDVLMLLVFQAMAYHVDWPVRCAMLTVFFCIIAALFSISFIYTGQRWAALVIGYGMGGVVWLGWHWPLASLGAAAALYVLAHWQLGPSLDQFPWEEFQQKRKEKLAWLQRSFKPETQAQSQFLKLGWPYDYLNPQRQHEMAPAHKFLVIGLVMWWQWTLMAGPAGEQIARLIGSILLFIGLVCCFQRIVSYVWSHGPPINFWGRLRTFRWIIPSYDVAFAPLAAIPLTGLVMYIFVWDLQMKLIHALPLASGVFLHLVYVTCPRLEKWRLTSKTQLKTWALPMNTREFEHL